MASTYTDSNRFTKQGDGENENTWGDIVNTVFDLIDESTDGILTVDVSAGNKTLSTSDGATDEARHRTLKIVGEPGSDRTVTIPDVQKNYIVEVDVSGSNNVTIKNVSDSTGVTVSANSGNKLVVCDGTNTREVLGSPDTSDLMVKTNNLSDLTNVSAARDNLSLGELATQDDTDILAKVFPVGATYFTTVNTNPATLLGFGTWSQVAEGRFIVGVGEGTDANSDTRTYSQGNDSVGEYQHTLTDSEVPSTSIDFQNSFRLSGRSHGVGPDNTYMSNAGNTQDASVAGGDEAHENSPPAFGLYVWERTA